MKRELFRLAGKEFDLIIIGAGAYGSCVAWEAASRGFSVALVEKVISVAQPLQIILRWCTEVFVIFNMPMFIVFGNPAGSVRHFLK